MPRGDGPFKVPEKVNNNAYKLELLNDMVCLLPSMHVISHRTVRIKMMVII